MDMKPIIVMAGTPVDTQMGMDCLSTQGLPGVFCPISEDPNQQTAFQISSTEEKIDTVVSLLCAAQREHGCEKAFIYCNSLSGALDFQFVARETGLKIVTPLDVYRLLAPKYHSLAVIAANAQGTAGIERTLLSANPDLTLRSTGLLPVVLGIEAGEDPDTLVKQNRLPELVNWYQALGAEALVLGCTHFPYFKEALLRQITLPVIDPAEEMLRLLLKRLIIVCTRMARLRLETGKGRENGFDIIRQFYVLVDNHFKEKKQVQDYAEMLYRSPKTLSNLFSLYGLDSPLHIIHERIDAEARRLLLYTSKSAKEISEILGFEDLATFSRFFKKMNRKSISDFRREEKKEDDRPTGLA